MAWFLMIFSIFMSVLQAGVVNYLSKNKAKAGTDTHLINLMDSLVAAVFLILWGVVSNGLHFSLYTIIFGAAFGIVTNLGYISNIMALRNGPMCFTVLLSSSSMILTSISGHFLWGQELGAVKIIGILSMLISVSLAIDYKQGGKSSLKWLLFCLATVCCNAGVGIMQGFQQKSAHADELTGFLIVAFSVSILFSGSLTLFNLKVKKEKPTVKPASPVMLGCFAAIGFAIALTNVVNLWLQSQLPTAIFFPVNNGSVIMLESLVAFLLFHERIRKLQVVSYIFGIAAILLLCI